MRVLKFPKALLLMLAVLLMHGCGYQLRADGRPIGSQIESLAIPVMTSTSSELGFEADFTRIIKEEFVSRGDIPIVPTGKAQVVLHGKIYDITTEPIAYELEQQTVSGHLTTFSQTSQRRLKIKLDIKMEDRVTGKVIWHEKIMEEKARFAVSSDPLSNRANQLLALKQIAEELAKRVFLRTMERF